MKKGLPSCLLSLVFSFLSIPEAVTQINFSFSSEYSFLKGIDAADLPTNWYMADFDDYFWSKGVSPFWYGDGSSGTILSDMLGNYSTIYLRNEFISENSRLVSKLYFSVDYDDGFIIWINGKEVLRRNAPDNASYYSVATGNHESGYPESVVIDSAEVEIMDGINTVAIQVFNVTLTSSDCHFDMSITARPDLPELDPSTGSITFSHVAGFYSDPFELILSCPNPSGNIVYTLDGSNPENSATSFSGDSVVSIMVDPSSNIGRGVTPGVVVRASVQMDGFAPSTSRTKTYIFLEALRTQAYPGNPWPSGDVNGQRIDLDMDPDVVNDSRYTDQIKEAFLDIPSMSLVTDNDKLFDPVTGIYVNAGSYGEDWERDCSLELIDPLGEGFQVNAGVRIRGGASRRGWNPKHAFRMFFRGEYGDAKLNFPLFGDEGTDSFDKIDIRTEQNYSWSMDGEPASDYNTFVKDIYSRKMQGEMGQPYARSRYYHLYLNGLYWGLFMTDERPESNYAESYFGNKEEDYDVVKVTTQSWPYYNIATDGNMEAWDELYKMCQKGFTSNADYFKLEGKDATGNPVKESKVLVDIDNLIDYMAMIFYTGNFDAPVSLWYGDDMPNNYYAIYNRKNKGTGFVFIAHDQEHSLLVDPIFGNGVNENRVTLPGMTAAGVLKFQPQWLHFKLSSNAEYRLRFADRVQKYFFNGGIFTPDTATKHFNSFVLQIEKAIIAESARWGDANTNPPKTKDDDWWPAITDIYDRYLPVRTDIVINQMHEADLLTDLTAPYILNDGQILNMEIVSFPVSVSMEIRNPNSGGEICYTTNGQDPRLTGGALASSSIVSETDLSLNFSNTTILNARIKDGNNWSALSKIYVSNEIENFNDLKVSELHYHPMDVINSSDTIIGKDVEFIEFKNTGNNSINISGLILDSAVYFQVPEATFISPGAFYVLASKPRVFYDIYGINPSGNFKGNFSNSGEFVLLSDPAGNEILSFTYSDNTPWPLLPDGNGNSLVSADFNPTGNPADYSYWRSSYLRGGSPFADDLLTESFEEEIDPSNYEIYPNPASSFFTITNSMNVETEMVIYDNMGKVVYSTIFNTSEITIQSSEVGKNGMYLVKLMNKENITSLKFLIL